MEKTYELGCLLTPLLPEEQVGEFYVKLVNAVIAKAEGQIKAEGSPRMITLAYPVKKVVEHKSNVFRQAYFAWTRFVGPADLALKLEASLKKAPEVVRSLLINLPAEALKEVVKNPRRLPKAEAPGGEAPLANPTAETLPLDEAALDQQINKMLVTPEA